MLPDYTTDTMTLLNSLISASGQKHATRGEQVFYFNFVPILNHLKNRYAQAVNGTLFDGSQFLGKYADIVNNGAIFEAAVMPVNGWWGFTPNNNQQAVAVCTGSLICF